MNRNARREGLTLLEVILATVALGAGIAVLAQLSVMGTRNAQRARELTIVQAECQTCMNELVIGARPLKSNMGEPIADLPDWTLRIEVLPHEVPTIATVRVRADKQRRPDSSTPTESFSLVRWIAKPENGSNSSSRKGVSRGAGAASNPFSPSGSNPFAPGAASPFAMPDPNASFDASPGEPSLDEMDFPASPEFGPFAPDEEFSPPTLPPDAFEIGGPGP